MVYFTLVRQPNLKQQLPGTMTKVVEKSAEENLFFRFDEIQFPPTPNHSRERQQFLTETQSQILVGAEDKVDPSSVVEIGLLERIRQKLIRLTLNVGLKCQLNWKEVSELVSKDLVESLEKCDKSHFDYVIDELHDVVFGDPDDDDDVRAEVLPRLNHNLLDILLQNSENFSPFFAFHEFAKDLLCVLEGLVKQAESLDVVVDGAVVAGNSVVVEKETDIVTQEQSFNVVKQEVEVKQEKDEEMTSPESPTGELQDDHLDFSSEKFVRDESKAVSPEIKWEDSEKPQPELISLDVESEQQKEDDHLVVVLEKQTTDVKRTESSNNSVQTRLYESPESPPEDLPEDLRDHFETPKSPDFESPAPLEEQQSYLTNQLASTIEVDAVPDDLESPESPADDGQDSTMTDLSFQEDKRQSPTTHSEQHVTTLEVNFETPKPLIVESIKSPENEVFLEQSVVYADADTEHVRNDQDTSMTDLSSEALEQINKSSDLPEFANPESVEDISTKKESSLALPNVAE